MKIKKEEMSYYASQYMSGPPPPPAPMGPSAMEPYLHSPRGTTTTTKTVSHGGVVEEYAVLDDHCCEDDYLYPPANDHEIAQIPPPKDTHYHVNEDPSLGGETWRVSAPRAPLSDFVTHCLKTPDSHDYERIIPWDHKKKDYVYGAVHDHIFRGRYDRRRLKRKLDYVKNHGSWDPVQGYNWCFLLTVLAIGIFLAVWIIFYIYKPYHIFPWYLNQWWWWVLIPFFVIMMILTYCCIVRASSNHATRNRYRYLKHACDDVNDRHLRGSGVEVKPGKLGAWIEVEMDPGRTDIVGDVIPDRRIYHGEERRVANIQKQTIRHEEFDHRSQIPIEGRPKRDYNPSEIRSYEEEIIVNDPVDYNTQVVENTVYRSGASRPVSNTSVVRESTTVVNGGTTVGTSSKKMSFYEKLKASKSGVEIRGSPTRGVQGKSPRASMNGSQISNPTNSAKKMSFYERLKAKKQGGAGGTEVRASPKNSIHDISRRSRSRSRSKSPSLTGARGPGPRIASPRRQGGSPNGGRIAGGSSDKKLSFYERLQKAKEMKERSKSPQRR